MDLNAYIIDYKNRKVLFATQGCSAFFGKFMTRDNSFEFNLLDKIICPEDLPLVANINYLVYDFFYSLPPERRLNGYFTYDFRIIKGGNTILINHKSTVLDLTNDGTLRLSLNVIGYTTAKKPGNTYLKWFDTNTVYEFIKSSGKFAEVKTQKLTSKATKVLELAGNGKNEVQIADILGISVNTVKYHKRRIFTQLGVNNTAEAIQWMNNQKKMVKP